METRRTLEKNISITPQFHLPILLLLYCLIRIPLLLSPLEDITGEISRGWIAHDLIHGLRLPFWDYTVDNYGLGSLLAGLWTVPFFKFFGETWFALKLAPFFWHLFSLTAWYWVWKSFYSARTAFFISLFFVLPPPLITEYSLANNGYHFEMLLWMALSLLLFKKVLEGKFSEAVGGFLLGLLGGFSSAMILTNLVMVATLLIYLSLYRGTPLNKKIFFGVYLAGFCLGFAPWVLFNGTYGWGGASFAFLLFSEEATIQKWFMHALVLLKKTLPALFGFRHFSSSANAWLSGIFSCFYAWALIHLGLQQVKNWFARKQGLQIEAFGFFLQIFSMVLAVMATTGPFPHYIFPIVPFVGMTFCVALEPLGKRVRIFLVLFWFGAAMLGNLSLIHWNEMGNALSMPGYSKSEGSIFGTLESKFGYNLNLFREKAKILAGEDLNFKREFYGSLSRDLFQINNPDDLKNGLSFIQGVEPALQSILYDRLGIGLGFYTQFDPQALKKIFKEFAIADSMQKYVYPGYIQALNWTQLPREIRNEKAKQICDSIPKSETSFCLEGLRRMDP